MCSGNVCRCQVSQAIGCPFAAGDVLARGPVWALGKILADWIDDDTLEEHEALEIAQRICFRNALGLYRLDSSWLGDS